MGMELDEVVSLLPQALLRVDSGMRVVWVEEGFSTKTGLAVETGQSLLDVLEPSGGREALVRAVTEGQAHRGELVTCAFKQARVRVQPVVKTTGAAWVLFEPAGVDEEVAFARALQEIARALGDALEVDALCAAAVVAMVRCAELSRAEVYLVEENRQLRRVATSDLAEPSHPESGTPLLSQGSLKHALATGQPEIGIAPSTSALPGSIFAAVPLTAQHRTVGVLLLYKERGASFSVRELDLWSAAAGQLTVAVENARLLREATAALRVRDEFMSIASHELKTPLTSLKMLLYTMERRLVQGQAVELVSILKSKKQVDRFAGLVDDLLDASRLELGNLAIHRKPLELSQLAHEVVDGFRLACERQFDLALPPERLWVWGDRDRLEQVLVNLLENAHKYSPAGRPISVAVERVGEDACLHVSDTGMGIPYADQSQIFQRFYRAKNVSHRHFGGLGLGLFISHSIVRLHGGGLTLQSEEGRGSRFTVRISPMATREVRRLPSRVLLIEHEPARAAQAEAGLRAAGFEVLVAPDSAAALRVLSHGPADAVVVSESLPQAALLVETSATLPLARPLAWVVWGEAMPAWAPIGAAICSHSSSERLVEQVRLTLQVEVAPRSSTAQVTA